LDSATGIDHQFKFLGKTILFQGSVKIKIGLGSNIGHGSFIGWVNLSFVGFRSSTQSSTILNPLCPSKLYDGELKFNIFFVF
jgi:hypothetical protein